MSRFTTVQIVAMIFCSLFMIQAAAQDAQPLPDDQEAKLVHDAMQSSAECVSAVAVSGVDVPSLIIPVSGENQVAVMANPNLTEQQKAALKNCAAAVNNKLTAETGSGRMSENLARQIMVNATAFVNALSVKIKAEINPSIDDSNMVNGPVAAIGIRG